MTRRRVSVPVVSGAVLVIAAAAVASGWITPWNAGKSLSAQPADTVPTATIESLMGPIPDAMALSRAGAVARRYEADFIRYDDRQWKECGPAWDCINYYDRAMIYYVWWKRTGNPKYRDRAHQIVLSFREHYLEANGYGLSHHWAMMDGVALHWVVTGDSASRFAVGQVADNFAGLVQRSGYIADPELMDNRIQAYAIKSLFLAHLVGAPSVGSARYGWAGGNDWAARLRQALDKILDTRDPDGQWRAAKCGKDRAGRVVRATHPFTIGLLHDALIRYYESFERDPRIPAAIEASAELLWREDWLPAANAFKYVGIECPGEGGPAPAADLNNLLVNGFAWLYKETGNPSWLQRADRIFRGAVDAGAAGNGTKWFNQNYTSSYRYLVWRSSR